MSPAEEQLRLQELYSYGVLNNEHMKELDDYILLAKNISGKPIALITLVDEEVARVVAPWSPHPSSTPRSMTFCEEVIQSHKPVIIPDLCEHPLLKNHEYVVDGYKFRFYAGIPLIGKCGMAIGSLCFVDTRPGDFSPEVLDSLTLITKQIISFFEMKKHLHEQEDRILASAKLSALGEMAAGVAHEINNPLTILMGNIHVMKLEESQNQIFKDMLGKMESTIMRISKIVTGLKTLSRPEHQDPFQKVSLAELVDESIGFCESRFKSAGVKLLISPVPENVFLKARYVQLSQVLINLLNNAFDAVHEERSSWVSLDFSTEGHSLMILVTDSGPGIPEEIQDKIMESFFTTKEKGKGTGLGLNLSWKIIDEHGGKLILDKSHPNTRFIISLPLVSAEKLS